MIEHPQIYTTTPFESSRHGQIFRAAELALEANQLLKTKSTEEVSLDLLQIESRLTSALRTLALGSGLARRLFGLRVKVREQLGVD
jgi:hypothetical protein